MLWSFHTDSTRRWAIPNLFGIHIPKHGHLTVCGDSHGQYFDTIKIFILNGYPQSTNKYVFNGDFVDRGSYFFENVFTLLALKAYNNEAVHLTRGNHETRNVNSKYGFEDEILKKYDSEVFELFMEVFNALPLGCLINKQYLVVHGGIGFDRSGVTLEEIQNLDRFREIPEEGSSEDGDIIRSLLWSDPHQGLGVKTSDRGSSVRSFGSDTLDQFLANNGLKKIIRSHQFKERGYDVMFGGKLVTLFSCPNYCGRGNSAAYMRINGGDLSTQICQFTESNKRYYSNARNGVDR